MSATKDVELDRQRELARKMFPAEWAQAERMTDGFKRRRRLKNLRDRAVYKLAVDELRAAGKSCALCTGYITTPPGLTFKHACAAESDFHGYVEAKDDGICPKFIARAALAGGAK